MSAAKVTLHSECTDEECRRLRRLKASVAVEIARMHKSKALLIAVQFAANHDCEFDASDALAAIVSRLEAHIETLDQRLTEAAS